jgi:poly(A) polymerase
MQKIVENKPNPVIVPSNVHHISLEDISRHAQQVLQRLQQAKYQAYLVGGGVRDLLLGREPKDFDIATSALPEEAKNEFSNSRLIGRRFRLVHVRFGRSIIEVATFRGNHDTAPINENSEAHIKNGMIVRDNVFGTMEEDAWRRDFTINALYLNIQNMVVIDYTGGMDDLYAEQIRIIGDAATRYTEDPVRMLRAVRFSAKLGFTIESVTEKHLYSLGANLEAIPPARLFEEVLKLFLNGAGVETFVLLQRYGLFRYLFPLTATALKNKQNDFENLILQGLKNTDQRIAEGKPVTPAFLYAIMLWQPMINLATKLRKNGLSIGQSLQVASSEVFTQQIRHVSLPKRFSLQTRDIWGMQHRLESRHGRRAIRLLDHIRFRASYDFLLLREQAGEHQLRSICDWWTKFQVCSHSDRPNMINELQSQRTTKPKSKKKKKPKSTPSAG